MKEKELREVCQCCVCGKKPGQWTLPIFYRVKIERFGIDAKAVNRQQGLAMMLGGNGALAMVMGPDEDMALPLMAPVFATVCEECSRADTVTIAMVALGYGQEKADG